MAIGDRFCDENDDAQAAQTSMPVRTVIACSFFLLLLLLLPLA